MGVLDGFRVYGMCIDDNIPEFDSCYVQSNRNPLYNYLYQATSQQVDEPGVELQTLRRLRLISKIQVIHRCNVALALANEELCIGECFLQQRECQSAGLA